MKVKTFKCVYCTHKETPCIMSIVYADSDMVQKGPDYCPMEAHEGEAEWKEVTTLTTIYEVIQKYIKSLEVL